MAAFLMRCDASPRIGVGHVMRCSTLACALRERGHTVYFAARELTPLMVQRLEENHFSWLPLPNNSPVLEAELPHLLSLCYQLKINTILVDHYQATPSYFSSLKKSGLFVGAIDDMADRDLTAIDWLLNQNLGAENLPYTLSPDCIRLFGPHYGLLRPQFRKQREGYQRVFSDEDQKILLTLGGGDNTASYLTLLNSLNELTKRLFLRILWPNASDPIPHLQAALNSSRHRLEILHNVANMAEQMAWADLSICGGGSTCWEMCCLGVPMLILVLSPDQELVGAELTRRKCAYTINTGEVASGRFVNTVKGLLESPAERATMSACGQRLVDGCGADRVAQSLEEALAKRGVTKT